jgi:hypothetical protein
METNKWVAIVYIEGEKRDSRSFTSESESEASEKAKNWVDSKYGEGTDWSLHHCTNNA